MMLLAQQVCLNHPAREAVARCVECSRFFCRECIAEFEGRLLCAECIARITTAAPAAVRTWPKTVRAIVSTFLGFICAWICFYTLGRALVALPSEFHNPFPWGQLEQRDSDE